MLVRMTIEIPGERDGDPWPEAGGTLEVSDREGLQLVAAGYAEKIADTVIEELEPPASPTTPAKTSKPRTKKPADTTGG